MNIETQLRKDADFGQIMEGIGYRASVEALPKPASENQASITEPPVRPPDLIALEGNVVGVLQRGGEVAISLNPAGARIAAFWGRFARTVLRYQDAQPSIGRPAVEVNATLGPGTNANTNTVEILPLGKVIDGKLWAPDMHEDDVEPFLYGYAAMPDEDLHEGNDEVLLEGRHGAALPAALTNNTRARKILRPEAPELVAEALTYGPDDLEDPKIKQNGGVRALLDTISVAPDSDQDALPVPGKPLPKIKAGEVENYPNHWARNLKLVIRPAHLDPVELLAGRITPRKVQPREGISMGDLMLSRVVMLRGGRPSEAIKAVTSELTQLTDMTRIAQTAKVEPVIAKGGTNGTT
jgi:hypothetical protein